MIFCKKKINAFSFLYRFCSFTPINDFLASSNSGTLLISRKHSVLGQFFILKCTVPVIWPYVNFQRYFRNLVNKVLFSYSAFFSPITVETRIIKYIYEKIKEIKSAYWVLGISAQSACNRYNTTLPLTWRFFHATVPGLIKECIGYECLKIPLWYQMGGTCYGNSSNFEIFP